MEFEGGTLNSMPFFGGKNVIRHTFLAGSLPLMEMSLDSIERGGSEIEISVEGILSSLLQTDSELSSLYSSSRGNRIKSCIISL